MLLGIEGGCKVGWAFYDDEQEANECSARESEARERKFAQGYDFGYQWPGAIQRLDTHPKYGACWMVVTT